MRPSDCQHCERAAERTARLVVLLRKAAAELHRRLGHPAAWWDCQEAPCRDFAAAAKT